MKQKWSKIPAKGTNAREFTKLLMSKRGATLRDSNSASFYKAKSLATIIRYLQDECGFDIRVIGKTPKPHPLNIYRIVGRVRWNGGYRSFITADEIPDFNID